MSLVPNVPVYRFREFYFGSKIRIIYDARRDTGGGEVDGGT